MCNSDSGTSNKRTGCNCDNNSIHKWVDLCSSDSSSHTEWGGRRAVGEQIIQINIQAQNATSSSISFSRDSTHWKLCDEDVDDATDDRSEIEHIPRIMEVVLKKESKMWTHQKKLSWKGCWISMLCHIISPSGTSTLLVKKTHKKQHT